MFFYLCIPTGNHTFAIVSGGESYILFKDGLDSVLEEINTLLEQNSVIVDGHVVELDFILGADYKVT